MRLNSTRSKCTTLEPSTYCRFCSCYEIINPVDSMSGMKGSWAVVSTVQCWLPTISVESFGVSKWCASSFMQRKSYCCFQSRLLTATCDLWLTWRARARVCVCVCVCVCVMYAIWWLLHTGFTSMCWTGWSYACCHQMTPRPSVSWGWSMVAIPGMPHTFWRWLRSWTSILLVSGKMDSCLPKLDSCLCAGFAQPFSAQVKVMTHPWWASMLCCFDCSFHVGSGCYDATAYSSAVALSRTVFNMAEQYGYHLELLDIGGGFPGQQSAKITFEEVGVEEFISKADGTVDTFKWSH